MEPDEEKIREATRKAALSGGITGGILGGVGSLLGGARSPGRMLKSAILGGLGGGALTGGATYLGTETLGVPDATEPGGYTWRAGLGGALLGAGGGALLGALGSRAGGFKTLKKMAQKADIPTENMIGDFYRRLSEKPLKEAMRKGAGLGAGIGGGVGTFMGSDEGMQLDFIENQLREAQRQRLREAMIP